MDKTQQKKWDEVVTELKQCAAGNRGWVDLSKRRAACIGLGHSNFIVMAKSLKLHVCLHGGRYIALRHAEGHVCTPHGRNGHVASRLLAGVQ